MPTQVMADTSPRAAPRVLGNRLLGCIPDLRRSPIGTYERVMRDYGDVVRLVVGPPGLRFELYCIFRPDGIQRVLAGSREGYSKGNRGYRELAGVLGRGLLTSEGALWQRQRRLIQPLFTRKQIAGYATLMVDEAAAAAARWDGSGAPVIVDAHAEMIRLTLRVVGRTIFGDDVERAIPVIRRAFPVLARHALRRATSPLNPPSSWPTPAGVRAARARGALYALADDLIARRRHAGTDGDDLLSRLLAARDAETGEAMDTQQIRDEALVFLLAGHETTSTALTFALQLLGRHRDEQERVAEEVADVLGGRPPTIEELPAMKRTTMVLKEAMRLYPPAYAFSRLAERDDQIGGYRIPAGSFVLVSQWATHRHPRIWPEPEEFRPERFTAEAEAARPRYAYFPFGAGPRACIGSHFAIQEAQIALAVILQRYRIRALLDSVALDTSGITLRPRTAVPIELVPAAR
jgi:cytochrome P450